MSASIFGNLPTGYGKTGNKVLKRKPKGPRLMTYYPMSVYEMWLSRKEVETDAADRLMAYGGLQSYFLLETIREDVLASDPYRALQIKGHPDLSQLDDNVIRRKDRKYNDRLKGKIPIKSSDYIWIGTHYFRKELESIELPDCVYDDIVANGNKNTALKILRIVQYRALAVLNNTATFSEMELLRKYERPKPEITEIKKKIIIPKHLSESEWFDATENFLEKPERFPLQPSDKLPSKHIEKTLEIANAYKPTSSSINREYLRTLPHYKIIDAFYELSKIKGYINLPPLDSLLVATIVDANIYDSICTMMLSTDSEVNKKEIEGINKRIRELFTNEYWNKDIEFKSIDYGDGGVINNETVQEDLVNYFSDAKFRIESLLDGKKYQNYIPKNNLNNPYSLSYFFEEFDKIYPEFCKYTEEDVLEKFPENFDYRRNVSVLSDEESDPFLPMDERTKSLERIREREEKFPSDFEYDFSVNNSIINLKKKIEKQQHDNEEVDFKKKSDITDMKTVEAEIIKKVDAEVDHPPEETQKKAKAIEVEKKIEIPEGIPENEHKKYIFLKEQEENEPILAEIRKKVYGEDSSYKIIYSKESSEKVLSVDEIVEKMKSEESPILSAILNNIRMDENLLKNTNEDEEFKRLLNEMKSPEIDEKKLLVTEEMKKVASIFMDFMKSNGFMKKETLNEFSKIQSVPSELSYLNRSLYNPALSKIPEAEQSDSDVFDFVPRRILKKKMYIHSLEKGLGNFLHISPSENSNKSFYNYFTGTNLINKSMSNSRLFPPISLGNFFSEQVTDNSNFYPIEKGTFNPIEALGYNNYEKTLEEPPELVDEFFKGSADINPFLDPKNIDMKLSTRSKLAYSRNYENRSFNRRADFDLFGTKSSSPTFIFSRLMEIRIASGGTYLDPVETQNSNTKESPVTIKYPLPEKWKIPKVSENQVESEQIQEFSVNTSQKSNGQAPEELFEIQSSENQMESDEIFDPYSFIQKEKLLDENTPVIDSKPEIDNKSIVSNAISDESKLVIDVKEEILENTANIKKNAKAKDNFKNKKENKSNSNESRNINNKQESTNKNKEKIKGRESGNNKQNESAKDSKIEILNKNKENNSSIKKESFKKVDRNLLNDINYVPDEFKDYKSPDGTLKSWLNGITKLTKDFFASLDKESETNKKVDVNKPQYTSNDIIVKDNGEITFHSEFEVVSSSIEDYYKFDTTEKIKELKDNNIKDWQQYKVEKYLEELKNAKNDEVELPSQDEIDGIQLLPDENGNLLFYQLYSQYGVDLSLLKPAELSYLGDRMAKLRKKFLIEYKYINRNNDFDHLIPSGHMVSVKQNSRTWVGPYKGFMLNNKHIEFTDILSLPVFPLDEKCIKLIGDRYIKHIDLNQPGGYNLYTNRKRFDVVLRSYEERIRDLENIYESEISSVFRKQLIRLNYKKRNIFGENSRTIDGYEWFNISNYTYEDKHDEKADHRQEDNDILMTDVLLNQQYLPKGSLRDQDYSSETIESEFEEDDLNLLNSNRIEKLKKVIDKELEDWKDMNSFGLPKSLYLDEYWGMNKRDLYNRYFGVEYTNGKKAYECGIEKIKETILLYLNNTLELVQSGDNTGIDVPSLRSILCKNKDLLNRISNGVICDFKTEQFSKINKAQFILKASKDYNSYWKEFRFN